MNKTNAGNKASRSITRHALLGALMLIPVWCQPVRAQQDYPQKLIRIIVPYGAGGPTDLYSRVIAENMSKRFGKPVIVDNRPGALAAIGHEAIARAEPDGYTFGLISSSLTVLPATTKSFTLSVRDFTPITQLIYADYSVLVSPSVPAKNMREFFDYVKANPEKVNFGSGGGGIELAIAALGARGGVAFTVVPFKGAAAARVALLGNQVQVVLESVGVAKDLSSTNKATFLAVTGPRRNPAAPSMPTVSESGYVGYEAGYWFGYGGPVGMPREIVGKLYEAISAALQSPELRKQIADAGNEPVGSTPEQFARLMANDAQYWASVAKSVGITPQ